jgi:hypothetical protein
MPKNFWWNDKSTETYVHQSSLQCHIIREKHRWNLEPISNDLTFLMENKLNLRVSMTSTNKFNDFSLMIGHAKDLVTKPSSRVMITI